ncbi:MAG: penicillin-binding transpeptidase domain-containing protein [Oscillospiraceae bacterium]|nr:penicillin-binding transpeptidase domain-containing protein [Oscillospiraceae bacterium]
MNIYIDRFRTAVVVLGVIATATLGGIKLMKIQIVDQGTYSEKNNPYHYTASQIIKATRGEIKDVNGDPIVKNKLGFSITIEKASFPGDDRQANEVILKIASFLTGEGYSYNDSLPITKTQPFDFIDNGEQDISSLKSSIGVNVYATAENCIDKLIDDYSINDSYTLEQKRIIAGIRYEMQQRDFSLENVFTLAEDISMGTVSKIKELSIDLPGVEISEQAIRTNAATDVLPHEIGTVGPIYAEEYEDLRNQGYLLNDSVGKAGLEKNLEKYLRGENGTRDITVANNKVVSSEISKPAVPGNTIRLTADIGYQREIQSVLENYIKHLNDDVEDVSGVTSGAIVVLDAKNNDVLALATAPTYDMNDYIENYSSILGAENTPLLNRATDGLYRPGSAFKTVTATAGLNEGFITPETSFYCGHSYQFLDITVNCTGYHSYITASEAIRVSCNIFFYNLAQQTGIDNIVNYAHSYGLGVDLGLESGCAKGYIASPETVEDLGGTWYPGDLLQAAIGQSETKISPLQMAVLASTIANRGVRYQPHIVDSIYDYKGNLVEDIAPVVAEKIDVKNDYVYPTIISGMIGASHNTPDGEYSLNNLGYDVAIKTGTPQTTSSESTNTTVIGFAPAENPVIAFAAIIENGKDSKCMVRKIIDSYNKYYNNAIS